MISNPFFLISVLMNGLITFAVTSLIAEISIVILRTSSKLNSARNRSLIRTLPFLCLFADLISNGLSIGHLLNPLNCTSCIQKFLLTTLFPSIQDYLSFHEISLLGYLGENTSHFIFKTAGILLAALSFSLFSWRLFQAFCVRKELKKLTQTGTLSPRLIKNSNLAYNILKNRVTIYENSEIDTPLATYSKQIFIPKNLVEKLPQDEFEALLAHELEHILWKDPLTRLFFRLITALFWWIPSSKWLRKLEFDQEVACDQAITRYDIPKESLASLLLNVSIQSKKHVQEMFCYLTKECHPSLKRLEIILNKHSRTSKWIEWASLSTLLFILTSMIFCLIISKF